MAKSRARKRLIEAELTNADWGQIHKKAWLDDDFKKLLETDPTKAIQKYGRSVGKIFKKVVTVGPKPEGVADEFLHDVNPFPPSCC